MVKWERSDGRTAMEDEEKWPEPPRPFPNPRDENPKSSDGPTDGRTDCHVGKRRRSEKRKDGRRKEGTLLYTEEEEAGKNGWKRRAQT